LTFVHLFLNSAAARGQEGLNQGLGKKRRCPFRLFVFFTLPIILHGGASRKGLSLPLLLLCDFSGLLTTCGGSQEIFLLRALQPQAAKHAAIADIRR
jgi:hypothetical protein